MSILKPWNLLDEKVFDVRGPFSLVSAVRENPRNGAVMDFLRIDCIDWVATIPVTPDGQVVFIRQYRSGIDAICTEIPAGCALAEESDLSISAKRELEEETGYSSKTFESLGFVHPNPGLMSVKCHLFIAHDVYRIGEQVLDDGEDIEVFSRSLVEVPKMIREGEITHSMIISAFAAFMCKYPDLLPLR